MPKSNTSHKSPITFHSQDSSFQTLMSLYTRPPYNLTLSLHDLLFPKLKSNGLPGRPQNAYILFLKDYIAKIKQQQHPKLTIKEISYYASKEWNLQPPSVIQFFQVLSMAAKEIHNYRPKRKYSKIKINKNKKESINDTINNDTINNNTINNNTINNTINMPAPVDSFPNFDVDFELYEPREEESYFPLF